MTYILFILTIIAIISASKELGWFHSKYFVSVGMFFVLWCGFYFLLPFYPFLFNGKSLTFYWFFAFCIVLIFLTSLYFGARMASIGPAYQRINKIISTSSKKKNILLSISCLSFCFFVIHTLLEYDTLNLLEALISRAQRRLDNDWGHTNVYYEYLLSSIFAVFNSFLIIRLIEKKLFLIAFVLTIIVIYFDLFGGSKYSLVWFFVFAAGINLIGSGYKFKKLYFYLLALFIVALIPIINLQRSQNNVMSLDFIRFMEVLINRSDLIPSFVLLLQLLHDDGVDFGYGKTIFALFGRVFPREYWPDRLGSSDVEITKLLYGEVSWSLNMGGIGEFYYNFGIFGIPFIGVLSGYVVKIFHLNLVKASRDGNTLFIAILLACPIWVAPWGIGLNNYFTQVFLFWFIVSASLVMFFYYKIKIR